MDGQADGKLDGDWTGSPIGDLDTPALLLDRAAADRNLQRMADFFRDRPCQLRPHFKNHKCVTLARRQLAAGSAVGMTCAKLGEAEVLAEHGFTDLLVANQVVGRRKLERLVQVARRADVKVAVDALGQAEAISRAAAAAGVEIGVLIEVDIGMGRCGVPAGQPVLDLARGIGRLPGLRLDGIQAFEGHAVYIDDPQQRDQTVRKSFEPAIESRRLLERNGIGVRVLSGGSSSTYQITGTIDGVDELQAGSYATMDWRYARMLPEFEVALSVLARVISRRGDAAVLDVGLKGAGNEFGLPRIKDDPDAVIPSFVSEEHCIVRNVPGWTVGQAVQLLPSHACTTCNLYRKLYVHEAGRIVDVWPIEAAGKLT
jgi:D-serine deaminase-like pyridoxal phosphate-dependent protein